MNIKNKIKLIIDNAKNAKKGLADILIDMNKDVVETDSFGRITEALSEVNEEQKEIEAIANDILELLKGKISDQ